MFSLGIGLTNNCNLHCAHCYRDQDQIHNLTLLFINVRQIVERSHLVSARSDGRSGRRMPSSLVVRNRHLMVRLQGCNLWRLHFRLKWYISPAHQAQPSGETVLFASAWSLLRLFRPQYASSRVPIIQVNSTILPIVGRSSLD